MYDILAVNPGHNGAVAVVSDGEVTLYVEEERLTRVKYDGNPFCGILYAIQHFNIEEVIICGTTAELPRLPWTSEDPYCALVRKLHRPVKFVNVGSDHHLGHAAAAFYNSGFTTAAAVIVDGSGSKHSLNWGVENETVEGYEAETIFHCAYPNQFTPIHRSYGSNYLAIRERDCTTADRSLTVSIGSSLNIVKTYEAVSEYLGFDVLEAGKTMGLAPYGEPDPNIPPIFISGRGNKSLFLPNYPVEAYVDYHTYPYLSPPEEDPSEWHRDPSKVTQTAKNLAYAVQEATQQQVGDLIETAVRRTGERNIVLGGGYALNCVANYYYLERFPDLNIYVDPIAHDGGTTIGFALYCWYLRAASLDPGRNRPAYSRDRIPHIYLGTQQPDLRILVGGLDEMECADASPAEVAERLSRGQIVAIFNGRSEGGPRALGNRSILFDPRVPNGKEIVNQVKGREWFRPFAGSVLHEQAAEWFDMRTLDESPFMMYAVDVRQDKRDRIPAVTHVDGTCRVQTVKREQNPAFYGLIEAFHKLTGCPILFNTSFNLAGEPLVETLLDAVGTVQRSGIDCLYLPEIGQLLYKRQEHGGR